MSGCGCEIKTKKGKGYCGEPEPNQELGKTFRRRFCKSCGGDYEIRDRDASKHEPQPNKEITGEVVIDEVVKDLEERNRIGKIKYGQRLRSFNGRNCLMDAYQEALDLCMYLKQLLMEQKGEKDG